LKRAAASTPRSTTPEGKWLPLEQPEENWDEIMAINLRGVWLSMKYEIRQMLKPGGKGTIVHMSSVAGLIGAAGAGMYVASQHGVIGLTNPRQSNMPPRGFA
jgi:NAD(P)-dependent dehydrogenase (short-subunit alcohol dehydrogenase family)